MIREVEAIYQHGLLRPLQPLALPENHLVRLTLDDQPSTKREGVPAASYPVNNRQ